MLQIKHLAMATAVLWLSGTSLCAAQDQPLEVQIVDALNKLFGVHPGFRANHAKGIVAEGQFKASPEAAELSKAIIFNGSTIPVTVRFSDSTGLPNIADGAKKALPHGIAIKYHLPDGGETDMVLNSFKFFPVSTGAEFRDMLLALAASPDNAPKPTKFQMFLESHPIVPAAFATTATPDSFADEEYYSVDAFIFVDKAGKRQAVRYMLMPQKLVHLPPDQAENEPPNFLMDDIAQRVAHAPVIFHLKAQLAAPGDQTKDPAEPWPIDRRVVDLGVLTIDKIVPDSLDAQKKLLFLPGQLIDGVEKSDDPLIDVRDGAYAISFSRRSQ